MFEAVIQKNGKQELINIEDFVAKYKKEYDDRIIIPTCPNCGSELFLHSVGSLTQKASFNHPHNCNTCELHDKKLSKSIPEYDFNNTDIIRQLNIQDNAKKVYCVCRDLICKKCIGMTFKYNDFYELLKLAKKKNIFYYKNLQLWMCPYILLTLKDFSVPKKDGKGSYDIRFVMINTLREHLQYQKQKLKFKIKKVYANSGREIHSFEMTPRQFQNVNISWLKQDLKIGNIIK